MAFFERFSKPHLLAAHRGARSERPENTLSAVSHSVGRCDFIEVDVQLSRDGVAVITHDFTLERTSDVSARAQFRDRAPWRVSDFDLVELKQLDFGSWFVSSDPFNTIKNGLVTRPELQNEEPQSILTLAGLLEFAVEKDLYLNLELKDLAGSLGDAEIVSTTIRDIQRGGCGDRVLLSSFRRGYLEEIKRRAPDLATAALEEHSVQDDLVEYLQALQVEAFHPSDELCHPELVSRLAEAGIRVCVFTVNDPQRQQELFAMGVTAVFSDFLPTLAEWRDTR